MLDSFDVLFSLLFCASLSQLMCQPNIASSLLYFLSESFSGDKIFSFRHRFFFFFLEKKIQIYLFSFFMNKQSPCIGL